MSLTTTHKITIEGVDREIDELRRQFLAQRRVFHAQLRYLADAACGQKSMLPSSPVPGEATSGSVLEGLENLQAAYNARNRHLNALRRVLVDEAAVVADAVQTKLPFGDEDGGEPSLHG